MAEEVVDALVVEAAGTELPEDDEGALGAEQVVDEGLWQTVVVGGRRIAADDALMGQFLDGELKERF